jgi:transcriptional regulator with XRE-family HTH domain
MSLISNNIKFLRKSLRYTQETFAEALGVKRSLIGSYEEGRAEPNLETLKKIAILLNSTVDNLISVDLSLSTGNDQTLQTSTNVADLDGSKLRILTVTLDQDKQENIALIPQKAAAGYLNGYADTEYMSGLTHFHLPIFSNGTFRAFEIKGDSMLPISSGSIIIAQYLDNWHLANNQKTYIVVTRSEGIVYKRIQNQLASNQTFLLISDNKTYPPYEISADEIVEVWEAKAFLSTQFPQPEMTMQALTDLVASLQKQIEEIKK